MDVIIGFFQRLGSLEELIRWGGYAVLVTIVFAETGLFFGFFLPGDSLLVVAGLAAAQGYLDITTMILLLCAAAIAGNAVGYWFGHKLGPRLFSRPDSRLFKKAHLEKARAFYEQHGGKAIVLARFIPVVRTFATIVAGAANMDYRRFLFYNVVGAIIWVVSMCLLGYFLGKRISPEVMGRYLHLVVGAIIVLSVVPAMMHVWKERRAKRVAETAAEGLELAER
jgi:membrane-associated protein